MVELVQKNNVRFSLILQCFTMGADVRFIDGKDEFSSTLDFIQLRKSRVKQMAL